jgi:catechol 2,3-dioxygenase-like lactoylglutathione lyase family enzyme
MFKRIPAIALHVADLEQSLAFYRDKLGLTVKSKEEGFAEFDMEGISLALLELGAVAEMINQQAVGKAEEAVHHRFNFGVEVEDVDVAYEALKAKGVEFLKAPVDQPWGQRTAYLKDPDGNIWEIYTWKEGGAGS